MDIEKELEKQLEDSLFSFLEDHITFERNIIDVLNEIAVRFNIKLENAAVLCNNKLIQFVSLYKSKNKSFYYSFSKTPLQVYLLDTLQKANDCLIELSRCTIKMINMHQFLFLNYKNLKNKFITKALEYNGLCNTIYEFNINDNFKDALDFDIEYNKKLFGEKSIYESDFEWVSEKFNKEFEELGIEYRIPNEKEQKKLQK